MISEFDGGAGDNKPEASQQSGGKVVMGMGPEAEKIYKMTMTGCATGITLGIRAFIRHRRVDITPTPKCSDVVWAFADLLTSEMNDPAKYPFSKSLMKMLFYYLNAEATNLIVLHKTGNDKELESFSKFIAMETTVRFLEEHLEEALSLFKKIREE